MTQKTGLSRNTIDKYYTNPNFAVYCVNKFKEHVEVNKEKDVIIEPSAGNGSFVSAIRSVCDSSLFVDIEPENGVVSKLDYLTDFDGSMLFENEEKGNIHIIGNPPFGRQSSIAKKFVKKSAKFADTISFILPKSFKKDSMISCFPLNFHKVFEEDVPIDSFLVNGSAHDVPCVYQIWEKRSNKREVKEKLTPKNFEFVNKNDSPDISFRRVGVNAGSVSTNINDKKESSHYFIKFNSDIVNQNLVEKLNKLKYDKSEYTVGAKSISKQELIKEFNMIL